MRISYVRGSARLTAGRDLHHWEQAQKQLEVEFRVGFPDAGGQDPRVELLV